MDKEKHRQACQKAADYKRRYRFLKSIPDSIIEKVFELRGRGIDVEKAIRNELKKQGIDWDKITTKEA